MRTITLACMAIVLFSALASARLGDSADIPAAVTEPVTIAAPDTETIPDRSAGPVTATGPLTAPKPLTAAGAASKTPSSADTLNFLSGVWESIGLGHEFEDFSPCIKGNNNAGAQLQKLVTLLDSTSATEVSSGLSMVDNVISPMISGIKTCNMKDKYTATVTQIVAKFANPSKLTVQISASITLNDVEVYPDITAAIAACNTGDYTACGTSIGSAMGKVFYGQGNVTSADEATKLNALPDMTWTAASNPAFSGMNLWQFKKNRITLRRRNNQTTDSNETVADEGRRSLPTVPAAFDSRTNWPNCIHAIRDQGNCGSCWAFAASEVLSDRFCIVSNKSTNTVMSPQYLVSCDTSNAACNGGYPLYSWRFLEKSGDVSDSCAPYKSGNGFVPSCSTYSRCADGSTLRKYYAKTNSSKYFRTPAAIQAEIYVNGPVEASMDVYSDFMYYSSGIYSATLGSSYLGGHAVKIVGWGNSNGINYWIVANSWGTYWGESGYFRIRFGSSGIDSGCIAGLPDLTRK